MNHGRYILGPEVSRLEEALAAYTGAGHCVSCASGTDALLMVLMAWGVGPGDAVFVPAFTFPASAEVVVLLGATPVFVDVEPETFNISVDSLSVAIKMLDRTSFRPSVVMGVDLFGLPADWSRLREIAEEHHMKTLADAAQSFGAVAPDGKVGTLADASTTSFFPAKPLGCYGDGGAVFTDDAELAELLFSIRGHGQGNEKYDIVRVGVNGRLDTLQAAILLEKLRIFEDELAARQRVAQRYTAALQPAPVVTPTVSQGCSSAWAQYTIRSSRRDELRSKLQAEDIPSAIYYPKALHHQTPYSACPTSPSGLRKSEALAREVLSLPMHPYLSVPDQEKVASVIRGSLG